MTIHIPVLSSGGTEVHADLSDADMALCGSAYCPAKLTTETAEAATNATSITDDLENDNFKTDITKIYMIAGIYLFCSISSALIIAFFVDPLTRYGKHVFVFTFTFFMLIFSGLEKMRGKKEKKS